MNGFPRRGNVHWVNLDKRRPAVVVSVDALNEWTHHVLVVPISFVTEHIETLHEINIEARADAKKFGITTFRMMPAVGDSPLFIEALKDLVLQSVGIETALTGKTSTHVDLQNLF